MQRSFRFGGPYRHTQTYLYNNIFYYYYYYYIHNNIIIHERIRCACVCYFFIISILFISKKFAQVIVNDVKNKIGLMKGRPPFLAALPSPPTPLSRSPPTSLRSPTTVQHEHYRCLTYAYIAQSSLLRALTTEMVTGAYQKRKIKKKNH